MKYIFITTICCSAFFTIATGAYAADSFPKKIEYTMNLGHHGCVTKALLRIRGNRIYQSGLGTKCNQGAPTPANPSSGFDYPLNGKETKTVKCTWKKGDKIEKCTNGSSNKYEIKAITTTSRTLLYSFNNSFLNNQLTMRSSSTVKQQGKTYRSSGLMVIRINNNSCTISSESTQDGKVYKYKITKCSVTY